MNNFLDKYFENFTNALLGLNLASIERAAKIIDNTRKNKGRMFILGVGGSAGNSSHAVNDFRKLCSVEAYSPTDNVSEITARTNDEGFQTIFWEYLKISNLSSKDTLLIFSVGRGNLKKKVSLSLIEAIKFAKKKKSKIISMVGKNNGYAYKNSNVAILMSSPEAKYVTPVSEAMQAVIWHALVSHPILQKKKTKW